MSGYTFQAKGQALLADTRERGMTHLCVLVTLERVPSS